MTTLTYIRMSLIVLILTSISFEGIHAFQDDIQKIQLDFTMPNGYVRHILLGFTPNNAATDGVDYGYDALNIDIFPDDLNWMIDSKRYVIQGVGAFDDSKKYPLGLFLKNSGVIKIKLQDTYNFDTSREIYIYDALLETYTLINEVAYQDTMSSGEYLDRFFIAFKDGSETSNLAKNSLSTEEENFLNTRISYLSNTKELYVNTNNSTNINAINIFNITGQKLYSYNNLSKSTIKIPLYLAKTLHGIISVETDRGIISKQVIIH